MSLGIRLQVGREVARRPRARLNGSARGHQTLEVPPGDGVPGSDSQPGRVPATAILLLGSIAAAVALQGGFFARGKIAAAALLAAAVVTVVPVRNDRFPDLRLPLSAGGLLAGWVLIRGVFSGSLGAAGPEALLLVEMATILALCRRLDRTAQRFLLAGLLGVGVLVAAVGWVGVVWRLTPWALPTQGLWRAASTLTYANATAALLVPLALVASALLAERPRSLPLGLIVTALLIGVAATLSRAGVLAFAIGLALTMLIRGRQVLVAVMRPMAGALVAFVGLLPSMPMSASQRPWPAVASLVGGLGVTAVLLRHPRRGWAASAGLLGSVVLIGGLIASSASLRHVVVRVWDVRGNLSSGRPTAAAPALRVVAAHPLIGVGPGRAILQWTDERGRLRVEQYVHDEYLQVLTELGTVGLVLLVALLAAIGRLLWRSRPPGQPSALWVGVIAAFAAATVHAGFDFVWHVPAVPLTLVVLVGLAIPRATWPDQVA